MLHPGHSLIFFSFCVTLWTHLNLFLFLCYIVATVEYIFFLYYIIATVQFSFPFWATLCPQFKFFFFLCFIAATVKKKKKFVSRAGCCTFVMFSEKESESFEYISWLTKPVCLSKRGRGTSHDYGGSNYSKATFLS